MTDLIVPSDLSLILRTDTIERGNRDYNVELAEEVGEHGSEQESDGGEASSGAAAVHLQDLPSVERLHRAEVVDQVRVVVGQAPELLHLPAGDVDGVLQ